LLGLSASGYARIKGDWDAAVAVYESMPVEPASLAALRMRGAEVVPVVVANNRGTAALWTGDLSAADRYLTQAIDDKMDSVAIPQLNAMGYHSLLQYERGELGPAEVAARRVIATASAAGLATAVQVVGAYLTMAHVSVERGEADEADDWLGRIADVEAITPEPHVRLSTAIVLALRREAFGDPETALAGLRAQGDLAGWRPPSGLRERWMLTEATLLARAGDGAAAAELLERMGRATTAEGMIGAARVHLLLGDIGAATAVRASTHPAAHVRGRVNIAVLDALLATETGDEDRAMDHIEDALAAAAPWMLRRPFLAEGDLLRPLLERRTERGSAVPGFALELVDRMSSGSADAELRRALVDPLTERERTVLRYLASALSNSEIAAELYVSLSTVKTHERALYRKLGAGGRREAVRRARLLKQL
jgi:LuxR family transcriptional regulator, maltose regulon positive regulatory protein